MLHFDIKRLESGHATISGHDIDIFGFAKVVQAALAAGQPRHTAHDDALPGLVAGIFQGQPGRCIGEGIIEDAFAAVGTPVVVVLNADVCRGRRCAQQCGVVRILFGFTAGRSQGNQSQARKPARRKSAGEQIGAHAKIRFKTLLLWRCPVAYSQPVYTPLQVNAMVANLFSGGSARVLRFTGQRASGL